MDALAERNKVYKRFRDSKAAVVSFSKMTKGTYSIDNATVTNTPTNYSSYGFISDYNTLFIDGTLIKTGDKKVILAISPGMAQPDSSDILTIDSDVWKVVTCKSIAPTNVPIMYVVQVRQ
jgi:hypothetical protein